jgi:hypothetical protein
MCGFNGQTEANGNKMQNKEMMIGKSVQKFIPLLDILNSWHFKSLIEFVDGSGGWILDQNQLKGLPAALIKGPLDLPWNGKKLI